MAAVIAGTISPVERRRCIVSRAQEDPIHPKDWTFKDSVAACYKTFVIRHELDGRMYDFVVVQSSSLEERKEKTLARRIKAQKEELEKEARGTGGKRFRL